MIYISKGKNRLLLAYQPDRFNSSSWLDDKLSTYDHVTLRRTFTFTSAELVAEDTFLEETDDVLDEIEDDIRVFVLGISEGSYYKIDRSILGIKTDLRLDKAMEISPRTFIAQRDISIFRRIDELIEEPIIVGGKDASAIPLVDFEQLLKTFPTTTEIAHYSRSRVSRILKDYFGTMSDAEGNLNHYLKRKKSFSSRPSPSLLVDFEIQKFEYIHAELISMLNYADSYTEKDWQTKILGFLLLLFPKYITVLENVHIKDFYSNPGKASDRYIDLVLVDSNGSIDITEVKKPFKRSLLSYHKYRNNHTPRKELSGTIMQAEKYLFHLNKWGCAGEKEIYKKNKSKLPGGIEIKISNPKALVLLGRDNDFTGEQIFDFEIIRRKYANMLDIMTYDDLLRRLENIIFMMKTERL